MNAFAIAKVVGQVVCTVSGSYTAQTVIKSLTPANLSAIEKAAMGIGGTIIGGVVGTACADYVEGMIDDVESMVKAKVETKESKKAIG